MLKLNLMVVAKGRTCGGSCGAEKGSALTESGWAPQRRSTVLGLAGGEKEFVTEFPD